MCHWQTEISFAAVPSTGQLNQLQEPLPSFMFILYYCLVCCSIDDTICIWMCSAISVITWKHKMIIDSQHFIPHQVPAESNNPLRVIILFWCEEFPRNTHFDCFNSECWICCSIHIVLWRNIFLLMKGHSIVNCGKYCPLVCWFDQKTVIVSLVTLWYSGCFNGNKQFGSCKFSAFLSYLFLILCALFSKHKTVTQIIRYLR